MRQIGKFIKDQLFVTIIYIFAVSFIIGFYAMTAGGIEIIYPVTIAVFFYVLYLLIRGIAYTIHVHNLRKLQITPTNVRAMSEEYQAAYDAILSVHERYQAELAQQKKHEIEEKRFLSASIHNLKTPVTVSSLIVQRVQSGELAAKDGIASIASELERLNTGMNMLLDLQRLDEMKNDYEPQLLNLDQELTEIINGSRSLFINNHVYPKVELCEAEVFTDQRWNRVLIQQIISNAVKYSACGENKYVHFTITADNDHTILTIKDEGIGIAEYDLPKVFDAYFTGENGRKGYNSSGIGLYLCKKICEHLQLQIAIENDHGCKVTITYP